MFSVYASHIDDLSDMVCAYLTRPMNAIRSRIDWC
jgi:hypothetical protein